MTTGETQVVASMDADGSVHVVAAVREEGDCLRIELYDRKLSRIHARRLAHLLLDAAPAT